jgi:quercetin dioxygenase-like cupin family protein
MVLRRKIRSTVDGALQIGPYLCAREGHMMRIFALLAVGLFPLAASSDEPSRNMVMMTPAEVSWGEASPAFPPGMKMAVIYGDPAKPAQYVLRGKMPAGYKIPPHFHSKDELVTVISGVAQMGMGDKVDPKEAKQLPQGSFTMLPAREHHYLVAKTALVVEVTGMGPFDIVYINPDDDPRKKQHASEK